MNNDYSPSNEEVLTGLTRIMKATHNLCRLPGCFRRVGESDICCECDEQRHDDEIDRAVINAAGQEVEEETIHETEEEDDN